VGYSSFMNGLLTIPGKFGSCEGLSFPVASKPSGKSPGVRRRRWQPWPLAIAGCIALKLCLAEPVAAAPSVDNLDAAAPQTVQVSVKAELLVHTGGTEAVPPRDKFVPAVRLKENDKVYYTLSIRNTGAAPANDVSITQPLPHNSVYLRNSANGPAADVLFSADGGRTFAAEKQLYVTDAANVRRRATPRDFTHIRLRLHYPLASQATALARYTVVFHG